MFKSLFQIDLKHRVSVFYTKLTYVSLLYLICPADGFGSNDGKKQHMKYTFGTVSTN